MGAAQAKIRIGRGKMMDEGDAAFDPSKAFVFRGTEGVPRNVVRVRIHPSVKVVPSDAFQHCTRLASVEFHEGLEGIGDWAFAGCPLGGGLRLPSSVTEIGDFAFSGCADLASLEIREGLTKIGRGAFDHCPSLRTVLVPRTVTQIGEKAFSFCTNLTSTRLHEGLRKIGEGAFSGCQSLKSMRVPSSVAEIDDDAFHFCMNLASIKLHEGLQTIGNSAFSTCTSLQDLHIPSSVTKIGNEAFSGCQSMTSVQLHAGLHTIGNRAFQGCLLLGSFRFPHLTERLKAINLDRQTEIELESVMDEISSDMVREKGNNWKECKKRIKKVLRVIVYFELKEAMTILELALWKMKVEAEKDGEGNGKFLMMEEQGWGMMDEMDARLKLKNDSPQQPQLSRQECHIKCGADIFIKEASKFFAHPPSW